MRSERETAVILAAGSSRRFGSDKRIATIDGEPMLVRSLQPYLNVFSNVYVVLRPNERVRNLLPQSAHIIEATDAHLGMGHSLAAAAVYLTDFDRLLVGLADMPWVESRTIESIRDHLRDSGTIVRPTFKGKAGHPVGFPARYLNEMKSLQGDVGARDIVRRYADTVEEVPVDDPGVIRDVDTVQNLSD